MDGYPHLKKSVRIKKMKHFCWVMEPQSGTDCAITPLEAFILASCDGRWNIQELAYLLEKLLEMPYHRGTELLEEAFLKLKECLIFSNKPVHNPTNLEASAFLYHIDPKAAVTQERLDTPAELHFSLTHGCNFRCIYCFNASDNQTEHELDTEEWLNLIEQAKELDVLKITLTGGEPGLHPGIQRILRELKKQDILTCLCTNGSIFTPQMGEVLEGSVVQVSLDTSDPAIHRILTGKDNLNQVMENIKRFSAYGAFVQIKCVLTPYNLGTVDSLYTVCQNLGVKKLILDRFDVSSCGRGDTGLLISEEQMEEVRKAVRKVYRPGGMDVATAFHPHIWKKKEDIVPCAAFRRSLIILPDGEVSACEKILDIPEMKVGNIRSESLPDIWNSKRIDDILYPPTECKESKCNSCGFIDECNTGCYALKAYYGIPLFGKDPRCMIKQYESIDNKTERIVEIV
jgi:radical SAM protein with 4Fe4S-binding SPASM domain